VRAQVKSSAGRSAVQVWDYLVATAAAATADALSMFVSAAHATEVNVELLAPLKRAMRVTSAAAGDAKRSAPDAKRPKQSAPDAAADAAKDHPMDVVDDSAAHATVHVQGPVVPADDDVEAAIRAMEHKPEAITTAWALAVDVAREIVQSCPNARVGGSTYKDILLARKGGVDLPLTVHATVAKTSLGVCEFLVKKFLQSAHTWTASTLIKFDGTAMAFNIDPDTTASSLFKVLQDEAVGWLHVNVHVPSSTLSAAVVVGLHGEYSFTGDLPGLTSDHSLFREHGTNNDALRTLAPGATVRRVVEDVLGKRFFVCTRERCHALATAVAALRLQGWQLVESTMDETAGLPAEILAERAVVPASSIWWRGTRGWHASTLANADAECRGQSLCAVYVPALSNDAAVLAAVRAVAKRAKSDVLRLYTSRICIADPALPPNADAFPWLASFADLFSASSATASMLFTSEQEWEVAVVGPAGSVHQFASSKTGYATRTHLKQTLDFSGRMSAPSSKQKKQQQSQKVASPRRVGRVEAICGHAFGAAREDVEYTERVQVVSAYFSTPVSRTLSAAVVLESTYLRQWFAGFVKG